MLLDCILPIILGGIVFNLFGYSVYKLYRYSLRYRVIKNEKFIQQLTLGREDRNIEYERQQEDNKPFDSRKHSASFKRRKS